MSEDSIFDRPTVSWDTPATTTPLADIRPVTVKGEKPSTWPRYKGIDLPESLIGERVCYGFAEDPDGLYMRLEDVARLLKRHGLSKDRWTEEEIDEARRRVEESTLKIEPAEPAVLEQNRRPHG